MDSLQDVFKGSASKDVDYIQYSIYLPPKETSAATLDYLNDTLLMIQSHIQPLISGYIWQKDRFFLSIAHEQHGDPDYPFLFGISRFGDCINDEWFMVYLLQSISTLLPEAVITIVDNDGDVLLIEAALALPHWLDPSNSQNRVYLHQGKVHIIPLASSPAHILQNPLAGHLARQTAIHHIRQHRPVASSAVQAAISERTSVYPLAARKERHRAYCQLPTKAAFVLLSEPQLVTLAIEAFYLRDPISLKSCARMQTFSPVNTVETTIQFTRTTYAQTVSQKFYAPKPFRLPSISQKKQFKYAELGMKLACGLEMLYHQSNTTRQGDNHDFSRDKKYTAYLAHLTGLGYFRNERAGSQLYKSLELVCQQQYLAFQQGQKKENYVELDDLDVQDDDLFEGSSNVLSNGSCVRDRIDALLQSYSDESLEALIAQTLPEESDDWMNVDPQQLEELLMKRMGHVKESMMEDLAKDFAQEENVDLESMMSNLENFVENKKSGIDGVDMMDDESDEEDTDEEEEEEEEGAIKFNMEEFMRILKGDKKEEESFRDVMQEMDAEILSHDKLTQSFEKTVEEDEDAPVDVQLNLVKNVLESFKSQQGLPGPVGNLFSQFGFVLPGDNEEEE
ncbi:hypothetical protein INT47_004892 [Mucor saturninus]|uniref:Ecdysoneless n=1 Tax=Mucor saturninus TaxID=64648 RepID=A0A8H7QPU9_9FUNG|nr:hypothetical protein INT47_004892 [Mucor saturninus]